jgi:hypothetical protein
MPFDVQGARAAGYTDKEIADHLAGEAKFDLAGARKAGYSDSEIIGHLSAAKAAPSTADQIPVSVMEREFAARQTPAATKPADPTLVGKILGAGETAASLASGIVGGTLGAIGGTVGGLAGAVATGEFGTPQAARQVEQAAGEGMGGLTYAPRTEAGREQTEAVGSAMAATLPIVPLTAEVGALGRGAAGAAGAARDLSAGTAARVGTAATTAVERLRQASPEIAARVQRTLGRHPEPTPGSAGSVGAAGTDMATQRHALADSLPVPVELTAGEASRDPLQMRFENEAGKQEVGAPLRERALDTNKKIGQNFDNYVDQTGTTTTDKTEAAKSAVNVIRKEAARDKAEIRVAYTNAEKSAEGVAPVQLDGVVDFLNESAPDQAVSKVLEAARKRAIQLGIAAEDEAGNLVPMDTTVKNAERFRRAIGEATDYEPTNIRNAAMMKGLIDSQTEAVAGPLYRTARRLRENYANKYENRAVIGDLVENKRGSKDRKVALEHVFDRAILNGDRAELSHLRAVLQTAGEEGKQAWKDLQGTTAQWLKDEAFKNSATDATGAPIASYARLKTAIDKLERGKRLDFIFGKQGAQQVRDLAEVVSYVKTAPPGFINSSNTASTILAALGEAGATGALTGIPVPVLSLMRLLAKQAKNRALEKRITQALHPRRQS